MTENEITWDEATRSGNYVELVPDKEKILLLTNIKLEKKPSDAKIAPGEIELTADVLEEDGEEVKEVVFNTTSKRLKQKLRPILENAKPEDKIKVSILRVGDKFATQYSCKLVAE